MLLYFLLYSAKSQPIFFNRLNQLSPNAVVACRPVVPFAQRRRLHALRRGEHEAAMAQHSAALAAGTAANKANDELCAEWDVFW